MIDCHAHLADAAFDQDRSEVLARAAAAGVAAVLVVGEDHIDNQRVTHLTQDAKARRIPLLPCLGLHPERLADHRELPTADEIAATLQQIRANAPRLAAIGEVGLDYWVAKDPGRRRAQQLLLERLAALASELDLPLNVHSRSAGHHTVDLLLAAGARRVLLHAFDGKASHAVRAADAGYLFSVPPSVVRSQQKQKLVRRLPLDCLALESDSPVLGPDPHERNEPANLALARDFVAAAHGVSSQRVEEVTSATALRLFPKLREALGGAAADGSGPKRGRPATE